MDEASQATLRVALLADRYERNEIRVLLETQGIEVVLEGDSGLSLPASWNGADVLLLGVRDQLDPNQVRGVLRQSPVPVLINRGGVGNGEIWQRRLVGKLRVLAERGLSNSFIRTRPHQPEFRVVQDSHAGKRETPWLVVLGASIGGPKAVARFLQALPDQLPVTFLLAQHISESFQGLLAGQLDRCSAWPVAMLGEGQSIEPGQVWMVPARHRIEMNAGGTIRRSDQAWESTQRPDINAVLRGAADTFGAQCGAIMFSGLGNDGTQGCASISKRGGFVWTQSSESCVISNLPEAARRSCKVEFSGTPEQLAQALTSRCRAERTSIN
ncbi:MAG: chemotaxis protein CheB [Thiogranum sp.]